MRLRLQAICAVVFALLASAEMVAESSSLASVSTGSSSSFDATLSRTELSGASLGLQLDASIKHHHVQARTLSVPLTGSTEGLPGGIGLQLSSEQVHRSSGRMPSLGLGLQMDAKITPGKPKLSLRTPALDASNAVGMNPVILRVLICALGMTVVFLALAQQEADQDRQSRIKRLFAALNLNRNKK
eukprot:TRINITY_DN87430_c0_g1_i1.p1 TRINITY_DN87430_c0_g1~~TRINITY_DN87430_c0_g1_i1.p1  ORF type:complete len:186 (+),score=39.69 TRINITY_DN87430_c0_g1_i1:101-658(+)